MKPVTTSLWSLLLCMTILLFSSQATANPFIDGRKAFFKGDFEEALVFYSSVRNQNSEVLYQTGLVYQAMMKHTIARTFFENAVKLDEKHSSAWAHLGEILYRNQEYRPALSALKHSIQYKPAAYSYYMQGLVLIELAQYKQAIKSLEKTNQISPSYLQKATYSIGVAHEKNGSNKLAKATYKQTISIDSASYVGIVAKLALQALNRPKPRAWHISARYGLSYDDNAILKPDENFPSLKATAQGGFMHSIALNGNYKVLAQGKFQLTANASYYRSMFDQLTNMNSDMVSAWITPSYDSPLGLAAIDLRGATAWVNDTRYMQAFGAAPRLSFNLSKTQSGSLYASYQRQHFINQQTTIAENRDANHYSAGYSHNLSFANQKASMGASYGYNYSNSKGANWDSSGHSISTYLQYRVLPKLSAQLGANYAISKFRNTHSTASVKRVSKSSGFSASMNYQLKPANIQLQYTHSRNKDNVSIFQYRRNIYGLGIQFYY